MAELERSVIAAETYDATENLIGAYGYYMDKSPAVEIAKPDDVALLFARDARKPKPGAPHVIEVQQLSQPVIQVSGDGKTAKFRARLLELGGTPNGAGSWAGGLFDGEVVRQDGTWKFRTQDFDPRWTAAYPGGWACAH